LKKTYCVFVTDTNASILLKGIISIHSKNHKKNIIARRENNADFLSFKSGKYGIKFHVDGILIPCVTIWAKSISVLNHVQVADKVSSVL
jgi:hypothetical protein